MVASLHKALKSPDRPWGRKYSRNIFILVSFVQAVTVISLESAIYYIVNKIISTDSSSLVLDNSQAVVEQIASNDSKRSILVYLLLFMFSQIFQFILSIESVLLKNSLQIFALIAFNFMTFLYSIYQYVQLHKALGVTPSQFNDMEAQIIFFISIVAAIVGICELLFIYFGIKLYQDFGWSVYCVIGSDLEMKKMLLIFHSFLMVLKFDVFFFLGFIVQFLVLVLDAGTEYYLTIAAVPIMLSVLWLGGLGVRSENRYLLMLNLFGFLNGAVYFTYKIVRVWTQERFFSFRYFLSLFASFTLLFLILSFFLGYTCLKQFGKGLDIYVSNKSLRNEQNPIVAIVDLGGE